MKLSKEIKEKEVNFNKNEQTKYKEDAEEGNTNNYNTLKFQIINSEALESCFSFSPLLETFFNNQNETTMESPFLLDDEWL